MILNRTGRCWRDFRFRTVSKSLVRLEYRDWKVEGLWRLLDLRLN